MGSLYNRYYNWINKNETAILWGLIIINFVLFVLTRYVNYSSALLPGFTRDTLEYYTPVIQLNNGDLPLFDTRTAGYPLFLYFLGLFDLSNRSIFIVQSVLTLLAFSFLISQLRNQPLLCIVLIFLCNSGVFIDYETYVMPMSVFASCIIFSLGIIYGIITDKNSGMGSLTGFAVLSFFIVLLRPQGLFIVPVLILLFWVVFFKKREKRKAYLFALINFTLYFSVALYNQSTTGSFTVLPSKFGLITKAGTNIFNLSYPENTDPKVAAIVDKINTSFTPEQKNIINNSWNYTSLKTVFTNKNYDLCWNFYSVADTNPQELKKVLDYSSSGSVKMRVKIAYYTVIHYFNAGCNYSLFYANSFNNRSQILCNSAEFKNQGGKYESAIFAKEYAVLTDTTVSANIKDAACIYFKETFKNRSSSMLFKLAYVWDFATNRILFSYFWLVLFFISISIWFYTAIIKQGFTKKSDLLFSTIAAMYLFGNVAVLCISIFPTHWYIFSLSECLYLFIFVTLSSFIHDKYGNKRERNRAQHNNALP